MSVNYDLPLIYPDLRVGSILYLKRIRANLFYDYGQGWNTGIKTIYRSAGAALFGNFHFLRFVAPVDLGLRLIYIPEMDKWSTEFLIGINFPG